MNKFGSGMTKYDVLEDPSHGWLKVDSREIERLGLEDKITSCSYVHRGYFFLEEDVDLPTFCEAKLKQDGIKVEFRTHTSDRLSVIRNYSPHRPEGASA